MKNIFFTLFLLPSISFASMKSPVTCAGYAIAGFDLDISTEGELIGTFRTAMGDRGTVICDKDSIADIQTGELADSFHCSARSHHDESEHWNIQVHSGKAVLSRLEFRTYWMPCFER